MKLNNQQSGMSLIVMIFIIGLFGYAIYIGIKITPVYMEYFSIRSAVNSLADEMKSRQISKNQYMDSLRKRLDINYVNVSKLVPRRDGCEKTKKEVFTYKRGKKDISLGIGYEVRVPIVANADILLDFNYNKSVALSSGG